MSAHVGPSSPINESFTIAGSEAANMWDNALPMPAEAKRTGSDFRRIRRSESGEWVIRKVCPDIVARYRTHSASELCELSNREIKRLRASYLAVISCANVVAERIHEVTAYTISPWLDGLEACSRASYKRLVLPKIALSFASAQRDGFSPMFTELYSHEQYSFSRALTPEPFLHDVDMRTLL
jgi:hypothetical protein